MATVDFTFTPPSSLEQPSSLGVAEPLDQRVDPLAVPYPKLASDMIEMEDTEDSGVQMHRIRTVRMQQEVSMRTAARRSGVDVRTL